MKKIVVAITGASGAIYARLLLQELLKESGLEQVAVVLSQRGREVAEYEGEWQRIESLTKDNRVTVYDNDDMFAPPASGSAEYQAMVVVPTTMGTLGRVASGASEDLIARAADVMLKERRRIIMVVRESPFSTIHLKNMTTLSECGVVMVPASPSFYSMPQSIEQLCMTIIERVISLLGLGISESRYRWGG